MKRNFTFLIAAFALMAFFITPMGMNGQTRSEVTTTFKNKTSGTWQAGMTLPCENGGLNWVTSAAPNSFESSSPSRGIQYSKVSTEITTTITDASITKVVVVASTNATANANSLSVYVGGNQIGSTQNMPKENNTTYTFETTNGQTGQIKVLMSNDGTKSTYIKSITVTYTTGGSTPTTPSNLALTDAPVTLSFDLYNNSSAQTISYTTSSTGTVSVQQNDYVTAMVDQQNKTITVTPKAITNGNQTITVNQGADATYLAGSVTFNVNITDSTPGVVFVAGSDTGSTSSDGSPDEMTKENVTIYSTNAAFATEQYRLYQSSVTTISVPAGYYITSIVFTGVDSSKPISNLSVNNNNGTFTVDNNVGTWTGNSSSVSFSASAQARASRIRVVVEQDNTPTIAVSPASLNAFSYLSTSEDPCAAQTISVSGANLSADIAVALGNNSDFEISLAENSGYTNSLTLTQTNGVVAATTIYVRMKNSLSAGSYTDDLTLSSTGATSVNIGLAGSVVTPMTVAQAIAAIDAATGNTVNGAYVSGIICQVDSYNSSYNSITYWISDDGETTTKLQAYSGKGLNGANFSSQNDLMVGDEVVVYGDLQIHDGTYEFNYNNYLVSFNRPEPEQYTLTVSNLSNVELFVFNAADQNNPLLNGEGSTSIYNGTSVLLSVEAEAGYILESLLVDGVNVTSSIVDNAYTFTMPKHDVTITASAVVAPLYTVTLCDDQTALTELSYGAGVTLPSRTNSTYTFAGWSTVNVGAETTTAPATIIPAGSYQPTMDIVLYPVYTRTEGGSTTTEWHLVTDLSTVEAGVYALLTNENYAFNGTMKSGHGQATSSAFVFDVNGIATSSPSGTLEITIELVEGGFTMYADGKGYLYAKGAGSGNLDWHNTESNYWYVNESFIYNKEYPVNNQPAYAHLRVYDNTFRTYQINSQHNIQLAKKVGGSGTTYYTSLLSTYSKTLFGYGVNYNPDTDPNEHWYLIASPMVGGSNPMSVQRLINTAGYDLYAFDQTEELEWRNYKVNTFTLESGKGYLYANSEDGDITFVGTPYSGNGQVELIYSTANSDPRMHGMNLVGNPFPEDAYIDRDFYTVNPNSNEFMVVSRAIEPMEGAIVKTSGTQNETMTFSITPPANNSKKLALNLSQGHGILDRAIVHFEESQSLTKLQMRDNSTSICIPMDGMDYASISAENQGEMPINFKAEENGTYTLSFNAEDVELNYLHLFDNMTGNDVDLLANPSYTFEAKKTDYRSRFKLVFATGNNSNDDTFAFYSSGNWVINNEGEATLQVVDVTGRIVSSEAINGCANININAANGVYMLRLVNGNNVKTQKIVVK